MNRRDHHGVRKEYRVRGLKNLTNLVKFFKNNPLNTTLKKQNFEKFAKVIYMMNNNEHLTKEGLEKIASIVSIMNRKPRLRYLKSSETIRQTPKKHR